MPWSVKADHPDCGEGRFAVVPNGTDEVESCHDSEDAAKSHVADLYEEDGDKAYAAAAMARVEAIAFFDEGSVDRGYGDKGGQFVRRGEGGTKSSSSTGRRRRRRPRRGGSGVMGFDGSRGTGYGLKGGDPRVRRLQEALNRLGLTDADGKPLKIDGKFGPKTQAAVKAAQKRLGIAQTGTATPALLAMLVGAKTLLGKKKVCAEHASEFDDEDEFDLEELLDLEDEEDDELLPVAAAADPSKPYGDVTYADPGYQEDGKKRYPLDSEEHCRAAWSYINMPKNAAKYTADQVASIKSKIKAAGKRYGIEFASDVKAAKDLLGIELARPGTWQLRTGPLTVTPEHLDDAARFANRPDARPGYLKIGHADKRFMAGDGDPALGWLHNQRVEEDDGPVLKGDLLDVPDWLAEAIPRYWPNRSIEGYQDYEHDGETYGLVVEGLALLGVTPPGMTSIKSLRDLPAALGVAASDALVPSGTRIVASFGDPMTSVQEAEEKGAGQMDPAKIREALELQADASDDEVKAALAAAFPAETPPEPAPVTASAITAAAAKAGMIVLASSTYEQLQQNLKTMNDFMAKTKRDERDDVIAKAVVAGKFTPAQKPHFSKLWDADPDGTRTLIDTLTPNSAIAVMASGYAGDAAMEEDELDREINRLTDPIRRAASRG